jgi:hypothetical protein
MVTLTLATTGFLLWGVVAVWNIFAAVKVYAEAQAFALGFLLAALLMMLGACLGQFSQTPFPMVASLLAMGTTFALLTPFAVGMLVDEEIIWSHHALRAAVLAAVWTVWLAR